jgi:hypothetical protein
MTQDYSEWWRCVEANGWSPTAKELTTAIRALVAENERLRDQSQNAVVADYATTAATCKADLQVGNCQEFLDSSPSEIRLKGLRDAQACISFRHMPVEYMRIQRMIDEASK